MLSRYPKKTKNKCHWRRRRTVQALNSHHTYPRAGRATYLVVPEMRVPDGNWNYGGTARRILELASDSESWHRVLSDERQSGPKLATFDASDFSLALCLQNRLGEQAGPVKNENELARPSAHAGPCAKPPACPRLCAAALLMFSRNLITFPVSERCCGINTAPESY